MQTAIKSQHQPRSQSHALQARLIGLGTSFPDQQYTQTEINDFIQTHFNISSRSKNLYQRILSHPSIETRHFALKKLSDVFGRTHDDLNREFHTAAVDLSNCALESALTSAHLKPTDLDYIIITTCTGYLCPGLSSYVIEKSKLRPDVAYADLVGMGCAAAIPALHQANNFVLANPGARAAVISTEISSAAFFAGESIDVIISNSLFGDGSAAVILESADSESPTIESDLASQPRIKSFLSRVVPEWREGIRFKSEEGYLRNVLGKEVPDQAAEGLHALAASLLKKNDLSFEDMDHWLLHAGGAKILSSINSRLPIQESQLASSYQVLKQFGNMSSPTVLFVLGEEIKNKTPRAGSLGFLGSFGAGFSAHGALLEF